MTFPHTPVLGRPFTPGLSLHGCVTLWVCVQIVMASPDSPIKVAALGRPFTVGMMYDARTEQVVPGLSLWDPEVLAEYTVETGQPGSQFQVVASDTLESKSSLLDIDASLKASFLGGLIEVSGSAKYLKDYKKYKNQCRATFQYRASTVFRKLSLASLGPLDERQRKIIDMNLATHVVTGIVYGANAFFAFDSEKLESSSVQTIQGQINAVMKKVPSFDVEGKVDIKLTDEEKDLTNKFSCTFYGDILLESNPATFVEAVTTYVNLPKLLKQKDSVAPLEVYALPLVILYPNAPVVPKGISIQLARKAEEVLEDLKRFQSACNEAQSEVVSQTFADLGRLLFRFNNLCGYYIQYLQRALETKLTPIRVGKADETELIQLFQKRDTSPFSNEKLTQWMDFKTREVTVIQSIVDMMAGTNVKLLQSQSELDREILDASVHDALVYVFTSLEINDPKLDEMANYLDSPQTVSDVPWYLSPTLLSNMREKAKKFRDTAAGLKESKGVKFYMIALINSQYDGASIYQYQSGALVSEDFSWPTPKQPETITNKENLMWYAVDLKFNLNTANKLMVLSEDNKKATLGEAQSYPDIPDRFDKVQQVICTEGLARQAYWEVEWSEGVEDDIAVGVTYNMIDRKDEVNSWFGNNPVSWCLGKLNMRNIIFTGHNYVWNEEPQLPTGLKRIGVFLDWSAGTLSYYKVSSNELTHLHTFKDAFTAPVYPGCYLKGEHSFIYFSPVE